MANKIHIEKSVLFPSHLKHQLYEFMQIIDDHLKQINSDYEAKRFDSLILKKPKLNIIKKNVFLNWLSLKNKLGGQNKIPRLNEKRTFIEEIKKLNL